MMPVRSLLALVMLCSTAPLAVAEGAASDEAPRLTATFLDWAAAPRPDKAQYELPGVSLVSRPLLSRAYAGAHFNRFAVATKQVCPLVKGRCDAYVEGRELTFSVTVSGVDLPGGAIQFTRSGRIVGYTGPSSEITRVIAPAEARKRAIAGCSERGLTISAAAHSFTSYLHPRPARSGAEAIPPGSEGVLLYRFGMDGRLPGCLGAFCTVDVVSGAAKLTHMCMGAKPR